MTSPTTTTTTITTTPQSPEPPPSLIPNLPDDISIQCLARIPRDHHTTLTLVSKHWRSTIRSQHLFHTRSLLNITQHSLYLNIRHNTSFKWYHLHLPTNPLNKTRIQTLPSIPFQPVGPAYSVLGPNIYVLGGSVNDVPTNNVWVLDCRINEWVYAMADRGGVVYDVGEGEWGKVPKRLDLGWRGRAAVVKGVLYCYDYLGKIRGYDVEKDVWKELKGVEKGLPKFLCGATMVDLGGRLCVVWERKDSGGKGVDVMCAVIEVGKDEDGGLSGELSWVDAILSVPVGSSILHCMAVAL